MFKQSISKIIWNCVRKVQKTSILNRPECISPILAILQVEITLRQVQPAADVTLLPILRPGESSPRLRGVRATHGSPFRTEIGSLWKGLSCALVSNNKKIPPFTGCVLTCPSWQHRGTQVLEGRAQPPAGLAGSSLGLESVRRNRPSPSQRQRCSLQLNSKNIQKTNEPSKLSSLYYQLYFVLG